MLLLAMNSGQYFERTPRANERSRREITWRVDERALTVQTRGGVFSRARVDEGTEFLIDKVPPPPTSGVALDLGCGWGPIALALAIRAPRLEVWAVDVNDEAIALTKANAQSNGLAQIRACRPEDVPASVNFDVIWSNPPIRVGKDELHRLLDTWLPRLSPTGDAWLVVSRHLGADSLAAWLQHQGWTCERHASRKGYRLLRVRRP